MGTPCDERVLILSCHYMLIFREHPPLLHSLRNVAHPWPIIALSFSPSFLASPNYKAPIFHLHSNLITTTIFFFKKNLIFSLFPQQIIFLYNSFPSFYSLICCFCCFRPLIKPSLLQLKQFSNLGIYKYHLLIP